MQSHHASTNHQNIGFTTSKFDEKHAKNKRIKQGSTQVLE